ncbi:MAG: DUF4133 domain-containing protein [Sediminibacterium magnilacihabitans]|jgi:hypothetical protein|nr:DUF4133 domain-containing protein [Sediminibacterium magnilacihabitans]PQV60418.1 uncharacterized protein DUF4133 [Sediminibacterium magnilacihabitans]
MSSVYSINKGVNRPIVFKGLKGQWIAWLAAGLVCLLLLFVLLYLTSVPLMICLVLVLLLGGGLFASVYRLNNRYGAQGWMKVMASRATTKIVRCNKLFQ